MRKRINFGQPRQFPAQTCKGKNKKQPLSRQICEKKHDIYVRSCKSVKGNNRRERRTREFSCIKAGLLLVTILFTNYKSYAIFTRFTCSCGCLFDTSPSLVWLLCLSDETILTRCWLFWSSFSCSCEKWASDNNPLDRFRLPSLTNLRISRDFDRVLLSTHKTLQLVRKN